MNGIEIGVVNCKLFVSSLLNVVYCEVFVFCMNISVK